MESLDWYILKLVAILARRSFLQEIFQNTYISSHLINNLLIVVLDLKKKKRRIDGQENRLVDYVSRSSFGSIINEDIV